MPLEQTQKIDPKDQKYKDAKYLLNLHLGSFETEIDDIYDIRTKQTRRSYYEYLEVSESINKLHCILMLDDLTASNTLDNIMERGIHIPEKKAILCSCGHHSLNFSEGYTYKALICEVALRKTKNLKASKITNEVLSDGDFRNEFDSIFVTENDLLERDNKHPYENDFVVFNSDQILPMYYIEFNYAKNTKGICKICFKKKAEIYCINDEMDLCNSCDQKQHGMMSSLTANHKRIPIKNKPIKLSQCEIHNQPQELVCKKCLKQICISCKLSGDHSEHPMNNHEVVSLNDCYKFLKKTKKRKTEQMKNLSKMIKQHAKKLDIRIRKMTRDFERLETQIYNIYQRAMIKLIQIKKDNLNILESSHIIMKNRLNELKWMEYFTKFQIDYIPPEDFIHLNFTHQRMQNLLYRNMTLPGLELYEKHSDFKVTGEIELIDYKKKLDIEVKKRKDREIKKRAKRKLEEHERHLKLEEEQFFREFEADRLEKQGLSNNARNVKRNSLLTNRTKRNSIHINAQRLSLLSNIPKLNIPNSESTRLPSSTNRRTIQSDARASTKTLNSLQETQQPPTVEQRTKRSDSEIKRMETLKPKQIESEDEDSEEDKMDRLKVDVIVEETESEDQAIESIPSSSRMRKSLSDKSKDIIESLIKQFGNEQIKTSLDEAFDDSDILSSKEANYLYLNCIAPDIEIMPTTDCLEVYSINDLPNPTYVLNSLSEHPHSILFLIKFKGQRFGAFSATGWVNKGESGNERNFLFNLNKDHKITVDKKKKRKIYQWGDDHELGWGATDLIFHEDGSWSTKLGSTYTTHKEMSEEEAKTYLCGEYRFMPEMLEIWKFDYTF